MPGAKGPAEHRTYLDGGVFNKVEFLGTEAMGGGHGDMRNAGGMHAKIRANAADFTLEEAYGKVKPQVDEAVACFRAALQEKATALFYDDMKSLEGFMRRDLDLEELWDIAAPAA